MDVAAAGLFPFNHPVLNWSWARAETETIWALTFPVARQDCYISAYHAPNTDYQLVTNILSVFYPQLSYTNNYSHLVLFGVLTGAVCLRTNCPDFCPNSSDSCPDGSDSLNDYSLVIVK